MRYLLTPQPWEHESDAIITLFGQYLVDQRWQAGLFQEELAAQLNMSLNNLKTIEHNSGTYRYASFDYYRRYLAAFGLTFERVFTEVLEKRHHYQRHYQQRRKRAVLARTKRIVRELEAAGTPIKTHEVAKQVGISRTTLWRHKAALRIVQNAQRRQKR